MGIESDLYKLFVSGFILVVIGIQVWAIIASSEEFPFGANVMFGHRLRLGDPLYKITFLFTLAGGQTKVVDIKNDLQAPEFTFFRLFFSKYYKSIDPHFAQGWAENDTLEDFRSRMAKFCHLVWQVATRRQIQVEKVIIQVSNLGGPPNKSLRAEFIYDPRTNELQHTISNEEHG